jgi:AAA family ATP:ADP antiporter
MSQSLDQEFGAIRSFFWPIHRHELSKIIPMVLMLFLICFNYSILRNMKDSLVVTASGAEVIPFIKVWVMLPTAVLLTFIFTRLCNRYSQERVFYIMISLFLTFFALFAFVLYPLREALHPTEAALTFQKNLPAGFKGLIAMCCNWSFTAFYVMSELWSTSILTVLFWGFANEITKIGEARRFYGVLGVGASCAAIIAGQSANFLSPGDSMNPLIPFGHDAWEQTIMLLVSLVIISGIATMGVFRWMSRKVLTAPCFDEFHNAKKVQKAKGKLSVKESFAYLSNSKYLVCIAIVVVGYNLVIHMSEVLWKDQLARLYPSATDYNIYMNNLTSMIGLCATITALFMAKIIEKLGWTWTALITPIMMLITCAGFFSFLLFQDHMSMAVFAAIGTSPLAIAVFFGSAQNCLSKAAKYSVFDATKEMAFIPLDHECKLKGKAAIDGVGSRIGKSGGSLMYQGLLMFVGSVSASAPFVAVILGVAIILWTIAVRVLGKQFNALVSKEEEKPEEKQPEGEWTLTKPQTAS